MSSQATTNAKTASPAKHGVRALLTKGENFVVGAFGSLIASMIQMPILTWKFCTQRGVALPETWVGMYRGIGMRLSAVIPLNVTTMIANGVLENLFGATDTKPLTRKQKLMCAFLAGCISSPIQSIMDTTIVHQQRLGLGFVDTWGTLLNEFGIHALLHGTLATAARESIGSIGFLLLTPIFAEIVSATCDFGPGFWSKVALAFIGSFPAAFISSFITMPIDAAKTISMVDMGQVNVTSTWHATANIVNDNGVLALYKGFPQRTLVLVITMFILPVCRELAISYKTKMLYGSHSD